jgi:hypothetical protein
MSVTLRVASPPCHHCHCQVCNAYSGPTLFCVDEAVLTTPNAFSGPFLAPAAPSPTHVQLSRCLGDSGLHWLTVNEQCGSGGKVDVATLAYVSTSRSSDTPRALRMCLRTTAPVRYFHTLDAECAVGGGTEVGFLGYVH